MGSVLRLVSEAADVGHVPRPFDTARFRRTLPKTVEGAFLRSAIHPGGEFVDGPVVLRGLERLEGFVRQAYESTNRDAPGQSDLVFLRTARRPRIDEARVRTAWVVAGVAWNDRLAGPLTAQAAWRDVSEGGTRGWVMRVLGEVPVRADGSIVRPGHARREAPGPRAERFLSKEESIELYFLAPHQHPDWMALIAFVSAHLTQRFRFTEG